MSETKNVVIQQNNGTDYDKLHPETVDSKVNLTDDNVSVWGNTLKDALPKINSRLTVTESNQWEIGDIRMTTKSDLGEKWLKADGSSYDTSKYPELSKVTEVQGFPFGTGILKKINDFPRKKIFSGANETQSDVLPLAEVNGYYIRTSSLKNTGSAVSFIVYYSLDCLTWNQNTISVSTGLGAGYTYKGRLVGYENRHYYFSFVASDQKYFFIHASSLEDSNWQFVDTEITGSWAGQVFYYNGKWRLYYYVWNDSENEYYILKKTSSSIDFTSSNIISQASTGNYQSIFDVHSFSVGSTVYLIDERGRYKDGSPVRKGVSYFSVNCENNATGLSTSNFGRYSSSLLFGNVLKWKGKFVAYLVDEYYKYVAVLDGSVWDASFNTEKVTKAFPQFVNKNEEFCYCEESGDKMYITIYTTPNLSDGKSETASSWTNELNATPIAFLETDSGVFFMGSGKYGKLSFGGVLPSYNPTSASITKLNTFIKVLD